MISKFIRIEGLSTFQHVFVGDYKGKTKVLGCHYWLDYYALQKNSLVSYHGYIPSGTVVIIYWSLAIYKYRLIIR